MVENLLEVNRAHIIFTINIEGKVKVIFERLIYYNLPVGCLSYL